MPDGEKSVGVSVIMPAYNAEKTIGKAIESVLAQTYPKLELIIIDDCSTDNTQKIYKQYLEMDTRVQILLNKQNMGVGYCRNYGIKLARYPWIAFLDSDDMWEHNKLEKQYAVLMQHPSISICFTGSSFIDEYGNRCKYIMRVPKRIEYTDLLKQNLISCSSVLTKKSVLLRHPMINDPMIHEDFAVWLRILREEQYAVGIDEPLLIYRLCKNSKSGNKLRAAKMQWRTYRSVGVKLPEAVYYFIIYALRSLKKYFYIYRNRRTDENYRN